MQCTRKKCPGQLRIFIWVSCWEARFQKLPTLQFASYFLNVLGIRREVREDDRKVEEIKAGMGLQDSEHHDALS